MASYWIVVPRENIELFDLLSVAFRGRTGFSVIMDRRTTDTSTPNADRRGTGQTLGPDEVIVAEHAERVSNDQQGLPAPERLGARQYRARRSPHTRSGRRRPEVGQAPLARRDQRLFTL
jgi:hypothetical protein